MLYKPTHVLTGSDVPAHKHLNAYVRPLVADVWYDLGLQLLDSEHVSKLNTMKDSNASNSNRVCTECSHCGYRRIPQPVGIH